MHISPRGLALVKQFEGCLKPIGGGQFTTYICPAGVLTIGWGHTNDGGRPFKTGDTWSQSECDQALQSDMGRYEAAVERRVKVELNQNQFDALVSFTYNCGEGNLSKSTLLRKLNNGDYEGAASQFSVWNRGGGRVLAGLTRRRAAEQALFSTPVAESHDAIPFVSSGEMPQGVDSPDGNVPWYKKAMTWVSGGGISTIGAALYDYRVAIILGVLAFIVFIIVWFTYLRKKLEKDG